MATEKSTAPAIFEEVVDEIYDLIENIPSSVAIEALAACIMGTVKRSADSQRALLAVIAQVTNLVRFAEAEDRAEVSVLPFEEWTRDAWAE